MLPQCLSSAIRIGLRLLRPVHLLANYASVIRLTCSAEVLYGALSSSHQLLALRASVIRLTCSAEVLYGALSSSHQHRSIQVLSYKKKWAVQDLAPLVPTTLGVGHPHRSSLAQTCASSLHSSPVL